MEEEEEKEATGKMFGLATYFAASSTKSDEHTEDRAPSVKVTRRRTMDSQVLVGYWLWNAWRMGRDSGTSSV